MILLVNLLFTCASCFTHYYGVVTLLLWFWDSISHTQSRGVDTVELSLYYNRTHTITPTWCSVWRCAYMWHYGKAHIGMNIKQTARCWQRKLVVREKVLNKVSKCMCWQITSTEHSTHFSTDKALVIHKYNDRYIDNTIITIYTLLKNHSSF